MIKKLSDISSILTNQRKALGFEQKDMYMRIGMKQQQYQRIEAGSDVKLSTLLRILEGLNLELTIQAKGQGANLDTLLDLKDDDENDDLAFWFGSKVNDD